jgi:hypothetical protein
VSKDTYMAFYYKVLTKTLNKEFFDAHISAMKEVAPNKVGSEAWWAAFRKRMVTLGAKHGYEFGLDDVMSDDEVDMRRRLGKGTRTCPKCKCGIPPGESHCLTCK